MYANDKREGYELNIISMPDYPEENIMYADYASKRISQIYHKKYEELQDEFHFWEKKPRSLKELREWLDTKNYTINEGGLKDDGDFDSIYSNWKSHFRWGPAFDRESFDQAMKKLNAAENAALDACSILEDADKRLQAVKEFESFTVH
jgi:hypothetical protein